MFHLLFMCNMKSFVAFWKLFYWNKMNYRIKNLTFQSLPLPKVIIGRGKVEIYIIRRNCTLWFWLVRTSQTLWIVKNKATGTPHGMYCIQPSLASYDSVVYCQNGWIIYLHHTWGFRRCSFRQSGQCEGLNTWNEWQDWLHVSYLYI